MERKPLAVFKPLEIHVPASRLGFAEGQPFEFGLESQIIQELGSKNPTTHINTPIFVEEVAAKVMQANKKIKLFQTMVIMSLNMGNLNLEMSSLKNILTTKEKEKGNIARGVGERE